MPIGCYLYLVGFAIAYKYFAFAKHNVILRMCKIIVKILHMLNYFAYAIIGSENMNATANDAETQRDTRRDSNRIFPDTAKRLGEFKNKSGINGVQESNQVVYLNSSGEGLPNSSNGENNSLGKVLARLKQLESEYLSCLDEHQREFERLREKSERRELAFKESVQQLERDILSLMSIEDEN